MNFKRLTLPIVLSVGLVGIGGGFASATIHSAFRSSTAYAAQLNRDAANRSTSAHSDNRILS